MHRERLAYQKNTDTINRLAKGYKFLVDVENPQPEDVDSELMDSVLEMSRHLAESFEINSVYVVGCGLGHILINLHCILDDSVEVGGCEQDGIFFSFGHNLFQVRNYDFALDTKEPPYHKLPQADLMISLDYIQNTTDGEATLKMMVKNSKFVIVCEEAARKYIDKKQLLDDNKHFVAMFGDRYDHSQELGQIELFSNKMSTQEERRSKKSLGKKILEIMNDDIPEIEPLQYPAESVINKKQKKKNKKGKNAK